MRVLSAGPDLILNFRGFPVKKECPSIAISESHDVYKADMFLAPQRKDEAVSRAQEKISRPRNETTIEAAPHIVDLEMQKPTDRNIVVRSDIYHLDSCQW